MMMNRRFNNYFEDVVIIHVTGKKIDRYLSYLYKLKIELLEVKYNDRENIIIKVFNRDIKKILDMKNTYNAKIVGYGGKLKLREGIKKHLFLLCSILIGYLILFLLSHLIFDVEVIHSNSNIRKLVTSELEKHNIKQWQFKPNFNKLTNIKEEILNLHKDRLEWIEIENIGTKYIIKVEERKTTKNNNNYTYQDIVSIKNAIIISIEAATGEAVKRKYDYVKKGDVLISGKIMKGNEVSKLVQANGKIYGEVWYNIKVEYPLVYQTKRETGKQHKSYAIIFLNKTFSLFDNNRFKSKISDYTNIISNNLIPFKIAKETQKEVVIEDEIYTDGEALIRAEEQATEKMNDYLSEDEYVISSRKLKYYTADDKIYLEMFFKVCESIGEARAITE